MSLGKFSNGQSLMDNRQKAEDQVLRMSQEGCEGHERAAQEWEASLDKSV